MEYFIPAWHDQYEDWAVSIPNIMGADAINTMKLLKNYNYQVGLIIADYQPHILSQLNQLSIYPNAFFSLYDYLQNIDTLEGRTVQLSDFNWPKGTIFDFGPFRTLAVANDSELYATVIYDNNGRILKIKYEASENDIEHILLLDSRGFVSSRIDERETTFFDSYGQWRFKENNQTHEIIVNPDFNRFKSLFYPNIELLLNEVFKSYVEDNFNSNSDNFIVTLDDKLKIDTSIIKKKPIFLVNKNISYTKKLSDVSSGILVIDNPKIANEIEKNYNNRFDFEIIPTHNTIFKLGHSNREKIQEISFFAENIDYKNAKDLIFELCKFVAEKPENRSLKILTYDFFQADNISKIIDEIKHENITSFTINKTKNENDFIEKAVDSEKIPNIKLTNYRVTNISQLLNLLDNTRVLVNYGHEDELMQMSAISLGIPQLQNFLSPTVINNKNGYIYKDKADLISALNRYLSDLKLWNDSLVYNVQLMNKYADTNIIKMWNKVLKENK